MDIYEFRTTPLEDILLVLDLLPGTRSVAENLCLRGDSDVLVVLTRFKARQAIDHFESLSDEARSWACALLRRRDVLFEEGFSIVLEELLEEWSFGSGALERPEVWREELSGPGSDPAERISLGERRELLRTAVKFDSQGMRAVDTLRQQGQESTSDLTQILTSDDIEASILRVLDDEMSWVDLKNWSAFMLGRREIRFESLWESYMLGGVLVDCASDSSAAEGRSLLESEVAIIEHVAQDLQSHPEKRR